MSLLRQQSRQQVTIPRSRTDVFAAFQRAGSEIGTVSNASALTGSMRVKTRIGSGGVNSATIRISIEEAAAGSSRASMEAESLDGAVGFGSAGKAIDLLIQQAEAILTTGKPLPKPSGRQSALLIVAICVAAVIAVGLLLIR